MDESTDTAAHNKVVPFWYAGCITGVVILAFLFFKRIVEKWKP